MAESAKELSKVRILIIALILALSSMPIPAKQEPSPVVAIDLKALVPRPVVPVKRQVSRSSQQIERRVMTITAYTKSDRGMNGKGLTASGERVQQGRTIAADPSIPFGTEIHIPQLGKFVVSDRGGAITDGRLDLYMEKREDAIEFGVRELEVWIKY